MEFLVLSLMFLKIWCFFSMAGLLKRLLQISMCTDLFFSHLTFFSIHYFDCVPFFSPNRISSSDFSFPVSSLNIRELLVSYLYSLPEWHGNEYNQIVAMFPFERGKTLLNTVLMLYRLQIFRIFSNMLLLFQRVFLMLITIYKFHLIL